MFYNKKNLCRFKCTVVPDWHYKADLLQHISAIILFPEDKAPHRFITLKLQLTDRGETA